MTMTGKSSEYRARHGVQGAQPANAVGDDHCRDTIRTRVSVGGVPSVQLVAATDHPQARILEDLVEEDEVEVAGHDEIIADPRLLQPGSQVGADGTPGRPARDRVLAGGLGSPALRRDRDGLGFLLPQDRRPGGPDDRCRA
jgi:hypothetical protein